MNTVPNNFAFDQVISIQNGSCRAKEEKSLIGIKKARKLIEADAQILANRIALLRNEELKSWKRIEEAKKKTKEIFTIKIQTEEKSQRKDVRSKDDSITMKRAQTPTMEIKRQGQLRRESIRQALQEQKHNDMLQIKQQREMNDSRKKNYVQKAIEEKRSKSQSVKEQKMQGDLKKNDYYVNKMKQYKTLKEREINYQESLKNQKVMEVLALGKMEVELVKKLQHTQDVERSTVEQLEEIVHLPLKEYKDKYSIKDNKKEVKKRISSPVVRLNQDRSLQEIKKTDLNESVTSGRRSQSFIKDTPTLTREDRSSHSIQRTERIQRIYGRPGKLTGRELSGDSVNRSMTENSTRREGKSRAVSRSGHEQRLDKSMTSHGTNETKKSEPKQNRSLLIDVGK